MEENNIGRETENDTADRIVINYGDTPIEVASKLILAETVFGSFCGREIRENVFNDSELRQIAEHLLVYCSREEE